MSFLRSRVLKGLFTQRFFGGSAAVSSDALFLDAIRKGDATAMCDQLDQHNANLHSTDPTHQESALHLAVRHGHLKNAQTSLVLELSLRGADVEMRSSLHNYTPLLLAASQGDVESSTILLDVFHADIKARDAHDYSALHIAAASGKKPELVRLFLARGLDLELRGWKRRTALHSAAAEGALEVVRLLVSEFQANMFALDEDGFSALDLATEWKREAVVAFLREAASHMYWSKFALGVFFLYFICYGYWFADISLLSLCVLLPRSSSLWSTNAGAPPLLQVFAKPRSHTHSLFPPPVLFVLD